MFFLPSLEGEPAWIFQLLQGSLLLPDWSLLHFFIHVATPAIVRAPCPMTAVLPQRSRTHHPAMIPHHQQAQIVPTVLRHAMAAVAATNLDC